MHRPSIAWIILLAIIWIPQMAAAQEATPAAETITPALTRTNIHYLSPFTPDGLNPALNVTATEDGVCGYPSSDAIGRPDAWDCISESDLVYDPCFENPFAVEGELRQVACFDSPFTTDVVLLTLTDPLVREKEAMPDPGPDQLTASAALETWDLPWALELANGEQCTLFGGTLTVVAGQVAHYGCTGGGMVIGETDRTQPVWVVNYIAQGEYITTLVEVVAAWS
jgi:hypothetical protein